MTVVYNRNMKLSPYRQKIVDEKKKKAIKLYKQGLTMREVGKLLGKSRTWVCDAVKELSTSDKT